MCKQGKWGEERGREEGKREHKHGLPTTAVAQVWVCASVLVSIEPTSDTAGATDATMVPAQKEVGATVLLQLVRGQTLLLMKATADNRKIHAKVMN